MNLLAIETSCDETAVAVLRGVGAMGTAQATFAVLGNALLSQIDIHKEYGGVYPMIAKREHAKNLVPLLGDALTQADMYVHAGATEGRAPFETPAETPADASLESLHSQLKEILDREPGLFDALSVLLSDIERPAIDAIAVTAGPGLEPALWVGVNFAKALSLAWNIPIISVNHMEGHICAALARIVDAPERNENDDEAKIILKNKLLEGNASNLQIIEVPKIELPLLSLLISGGHTELVLSKEWGSYELLGATRDDAVGEAFDKVARMLGLPYPGGPEVSKLAEFARDLDLPADTTTSNTPRLPRPMINEPHCDFSFSGLKTAVLYAVKDKELSDEEKQRMAREFEDAAADVLYAKTKRALEESGAKTLALGGGVSANTHIQRTFRDRLAQDFPDVHLAIPTPTLTTDNAIMIGLAGFYHALSGDFADPTALRADGNRKLV